MVELKFLNKKVVFLLITIILLIVIFFGLNRQSQKTINIPNEDCYIEVEKTVDGTSMEPLLSNGKSVVLQEGFYACNNIVKGDVIGFHLKTGEEDFIKIVKALPGDRLTIQNNIILVNGEKITNSVGKYYSVDAIAKTLLLTPLRDNVIPPNSYLVLADDTSLDSFDSRKVGYISKSHILGKIKY